MFAPSEKKTGVTGVLFLELHLCAKIVHFEKQETPVSRCARRQYTRALHSRRRVLRANSRRRLTSLQDSSLFFLLARGCAISAQLTQKQCDQKPDTPFIPAFSLFDAGIFLNQRFLSFFYFFFFSHFASFWVRKNLK